MANPKLQFHVEVDLAQWIQQQADQAGLSSSEWLRQLLRLKKRESGG